MARIPLVTRDPEMAQRLEALRCAQHGVMTLTNLIARYAVLASSMNTYELQAPAHPTEKALTT
jgi:hypothetical protein